MAVQTGATLRTLTGHDNLVSSVAFSPDGTFVASGSGDNTVRLWQVQTGETLRMLTEHNSGIDAIAFSPSGKMIASASWDKTIRLWDVDTGAALRTLTGSSQWGDTVAFAPDGTLVASGSRDNTVRLWNVETAVSSAYPDRTYGPHFVRGVFSRWEIPGEWEPGQYGASVGGRNRNPGADAGRA